MKNNSYLHKVLCILAATAIVLCLPLKVYADGSIAVSARKEGISTYRIYMVASGFFKDGFLWNIRVDDDFTLDFWNELGCLAGTEAESIIEWMETQVEGDKNGKFLLKFAGLVDKDGITPDFQLHSGESIALKDGYYLVTCKDSRPMLILSGGGKERTIFEKPLEEPKTGDRTDIWLYVILGALSAVGLSAAVASFWSSRDEDEKK